jgi:Tfp pilus assembly protein PilO
MTARDLIARVLVERRRVLVPLGIIAAVNLAVYALAIYPLSLKVAASERRAVAARAQLDQAQHQDRTARATVSRAAQADADLQRFYHDALPRGMEAARRMTYTSLADLAADNDLVIERRSYDPDTASKGRLQKLKIGMALTGEYGDIRQFVHALETSPEFIVIEDLAVSEGDNPDAPLSVTVQLATYFEEAADGR